jgi:hypothetical protein
MPVDFQFITQYSVSGTELFMTSVVGTSVPKLIGIKMSEIKREYFFSHL